MPCATRDASLQMVVEIRCLHIAERAHDVPYKVVDELVARFHEDLIRYYSIMLRSRLSAPQPRGCRCGPWE